MFTGITPTLAAINPTYVMFALYLLVMLGIGFVFVSRIRSTTEYFLGGRGVGAWVTAMSAEASDMSGWLLMGLPGAIFLAGIGKGWVAIGLAVGTILNWIFIAPRLRVYTEKTKSLTLPGFFSERFRETKKLRLLSAVVILFFFTIYASSGLIAAGKLFEEMFKIPYEWAILIGTATILIYTILGGYLAVCWTDLIQGVLMFGALVVVPILAYMNLPADASETIYAAVKNQEGEAVSPMLLFPDGFGIMAIVGIISSAVWGLGYCGQPHILTRFMSIKDHKLLPRSTWIASIWVLVSLVAAAVIALLARAYYLKEITVKLAEKTETQLIAKAAAAGKIISKEDLDVAVDQVVKAASEKVFIDLILDLVNPWVGGILLAAILAAIMSTIDSQLLVSSSALTEDFYTKILRKDASTNEQVWVSRGGVLAITLIAMGLAFALEERSKTIFSIVEFAWGGFGAAFGPVVIMALYSRKTSWQSALCGMLAGFIVMLVWSIAGFGKYMYEILPGFIAGLVVIIIMNQVFPQKDEEILKEYDDMVDAVRK